MKYRGKFHTSPFFQKYEEIPSPEVSIEYYGPGASRPLIEGRTLQPGEKLILWRGENKVPLKVSLYKYPAGWGVDVTQWLPAICWGSSEC